MKHLLLAALLVGCHVGASPAPASHKLGANSHGAPVLFMISGDSADAASTTTIGPSVADLESYDFLNIDATIVGATGGATTVFLQKLVATSPDTWVDFVSFPSVAAGTTKTYNAAVENVADGITYLVGTGTDDAATPTLEAGVIAHGHPGRVLRLVTVTGSGVTAPAVVTVYINGRSRAD